MSSHVQLIALDSPRTENLPDEFYQDLIDKLEPHTFALTQAFI